MFLSEHDGVTAIDLVGQLGFHKSTVHRRLNDLQSAGLARSEGRPMRWFFVDRDLGEVAVQLGVDGAEDRQRLRHETERASYYYAKVLGAQRKVQHR